MATKFILQRFAAIFLLLVSINAYAQAPETTLVSGVLYKGDGTVAANATFKITRVVKNGVAVTTGERTIPANSSGVVSFNVLRGATITLQGAVIIGGSDLTIARTFQVPNTSTATLESMASVAQVPANGITLKLNNVAQTNKIGTLDLISGFTVTESPNGELNISVPPGYTNTDADARIAAAVGVTVQAFDTDLNVIAGLAPSNDDVIQRKAGAWTNRTPAQFKVDLALVKADVGLGNAENTSDANKPVSTAQQSAIDAASVLDRARGNHTGTQAISTVSGLQAALDAKPSNSAGANVIPKSNGTNLVASRISDDGNDVAVELGSGTKSFSVAGTSGHFRVDTSASFNNSGIESGVGGATIGDFEGVTNGTYFSFLQSPNIFKIQTVGTFNAGDADESGNGTHISIADATRTISISSPNAGMAIVGNATASSTVANLFASVVGLGDTEINGNGTSLNIDDNTQTVTITAPTVNVGSNGAAVTIAGSTLSAFARTLIDDANQATAQTTLGLGTGNSPTFTGLSLSGLTTGSIPFVGASGLISQDNAALFWDATNDRLGLGTITPQNVLEVRKDAASTTRIIVNNSNASGLAAFSIYSGTDEKGRMQYNVGAPNIFFTTIPAIPFYIGTNDTIRLAVDATGLVGINKNSSMAGQLHVVSSAIGTIPLIADSPAGQTANLFEARVNGGAVLNISPAGNLRWGSTSASPMLKKTGTILTARLADDSAYADIDVAGIYINSTSDTAINSVGGIRISNSKQFSWAGGDAGLARASAGVVKASDGSSGYGIFDASAYRVAGTARLDSTGAFVPPSLADGAAANNTVYYSTTASKLVYKDAGGVVNALY